MKCVICGKEFKPHVGNQITCSPACSYERARRRENTYPKRVKKEKQKRICPVCGREFMPKYWNEIACSVRCRDLRRHNEATIDPETWKLIFNWQRAPEDPKHLDKTLAKLKAEKIEYAEKQKRETIEKFARVKV